MLIIDRVERYKGTSCLRDRIHFAVRCVDRYWHGFASYKKGN